MRGDRLEMHLTVRACKSIDGMEGARRAV